MHLKLCVSSNVCNLRQICISGFPAIAGMSCFEVSNSKFVLFIFSPPKPRWYLWFTMSWTGGRNGAEDNSASACRFQSLLSAGARSRSGKLFLQAEGSIWTWYPLQSIQVSALPPAILIRLALDNVMSTVFKANYETLNHRNDFRDGGPAPVCAELTN